MDLMKKVLWGLLLAVLVLSSSGVLIRTGNENNNKAVVTAVDYREFQKMADYANYDMQEVLQRLKANGVSRVTVKEVSLLDLAERGDIKLSTFGELKADLQAEDPAGWQEAQKVLSRVDISPVNLTAATSDKETADFLASHLNKRLAGNELVNFSIGDVNYFVINTEIIQPAKTTDKEYPRDMLVGFDYRQLNELSAAGFEIVLSPGNTIGSNYQYINKYEEIVDEYDVRYMVINGEVPGYPEQLERIQELVERNQLIVGIIETPVQLGYLEQKGLPELIEATDYPVNRVYSTRNDEYLKDMNERYYRWVRSVVDRGIRILYVVPFENNKLSYAENLDNTIDTIGQFHLAMKEKGFVVDQPLQHLSTESPGKYSRMMVSLSLLLGTVLYFIYLFKPRKAAIYSLLILGLLACAGLNLVLDADFSKIYALGAAIIYPSLSSLLLLIYLRDNHQRRMLVQIITSLFIILGVNALGMFTIVTSLADIRYIMNIEYFRGVKLAFLIPLILFAVNYLCCFAREEGIVSFTKKYLLMKPNYLILAMLGVALIGLYYYLARSGHTAGVSVPAYEIRMREILESIFIARPRFKEIMIGYPALLAMVYLYRKYRYDLITLVFGLGVMIGSISMVNSFAHVFTAVTISIHRTLAGLAIGLVIGLGVMAGIIILEWIYFRWIKQAS